MNRSIQIPLLFLATLPAVSWGEQGAAVNFNRDVRPILSDKCFACHGPDEKKRESKLRLDIREHALKPGESGETAIVPGKPEASQLIARVTSKDRDEVMPPPKTHKPVSPQEAATLRRWIAEGAPYQGHWAFLKPERPPVPSAAPNPIDAFILARLQKEGLQASPEAPRETLIRRVSLDLTGLPPTPEEVSAFLADSSPQAYERVVDRLLASPRYGEKMAQEWLDFARYADSNGFQSDGSRFMWPWRDWVIRAYNSNQPFDQFTIEQVAGDLLPNATLSQKVATGFHRNTRLNGEGGRIEAEWFAETVIDRVDTTGQTWLGLTLGCARCHDHKYDPISQREFYQLFAYFNSNEESGVLDGDGRNTKPLVAVPTAEHEKQLAVLETSRNAAQEELDAAKRTQQQTSEPADQVRESADAAAKKAAAALAAAQKAIATHVASYPTTMIFQERAHPRDAFVLKRGEYDQPGEKVERGLPAVLPPLPAGAPNNRLGLAQWLVSGEHPLTARVWVNRAWEKFFGTGLVRTSENLGSQADWPSHPELLDWLATEFVRLKWDMKATQKLIVMSAAYRQSARVTPTLLERDPDNRLVARGPRFRLSAESVRDQALAVSGLLVEKLGGPSVRPYMPARVWDETSVYGDLRGYKADSGEGLYRRTLYTIWKRTAAPPTMLLFDSPNREICTAKRSRSNTPLQALALLNEVTYVEAARHLAEQMILAGGSTPGARLAWAFRRATARQPDAAELKTLTAGLAARLARFQQDEAAAKQLIEQGSSKPDAKLNPAELAAYTTAANIILNLDEVVTRE